MHYTTNPKVRSARLLRPAGSNRSSDLRLIVHMIEDEDSTGMVRVMDVSKRTRAVVTELERMTGSNLPRRMNSLVKHYKTPVDGIALWRTLPLGRPWQLGGVSLYTAQAMDLSDVPFCLWQERVEEPGGYHHWEARAGWLHEFDVPSSNSLSPGLACVARDDRKVWIPSENLLAVDYLDHMNLA